MHSSISFNDLFKSKTTVWFWFLFLRELTDDPACCTLLTFHQPWPGERQCLVKKRFEEKKQKLTSGPSPVFIDGPHLGSSFNVTLGVSVNFLLPHLILSLKTLEKLYQNVKTPHKIPPIKIGNL